MKSFGDLVKQAQKMQNGELPFSFGGQSLTARDLGLTEDDLIKQSAPEVAQGLQMAQGFNPFSYNTQQMLLSPQDLLQRQDALDYHNYQNNVQRQLMLNQRRNVGLDTITGVLKGIGSFTGI